MRGLALVVVVAVAAFRAAAAAAQDAACACPTPTTQQGFDAEKYLGLWYEMRRVTRGFEKNGQCGTASYSWTDESKSVVNVINSNYVPSLSANYEVNLLAKPTNAAEGKFEVTFPMRPDNPPSIYWVLSTDYNTYSIVYSCSEPQPTSLKKLPSITLWVLSRDPEKFDATVSQKVDTMLKEKGFDDTEFEIIRHDCPPTACKACPKTKANLNLEKLAGRWWEVQHSPFATGSDTLSCSFADLSATDEGLSLNGNTFATSSGSDGSDKSLTIAGKWRDAATKNGEFSVTKGFNGDQNDRICVVDTDYDNWAVLSVCGAPAQGSTLQPGMTRSPIGGVYVLSRKRGLRSADQMKANEAVLSAGLGLAASSLVSTPTSPCPSVAFDKSGSATPALGIVGLLVSLALCTLLAMPPA